MNDLTYNITMEDVFNERLRTITNDKQPEWQQELQQELQPESLYAALVLRLAKNSLSKQGLADALGHKSISGQFKVLIAKLLDDQLIEWTIPEKPNSSKLKYKLTKRGLAFYALIKEEDKV